MKHLPEIKGETKLQSNGSKDRLGETYVYGSTKLFGGTHCSDDEEESLIADPSESDDPSESLPSPISKHFLHLRSGVTISATLRKLLVPYNQPHLLRHLLGGLESSTVEPMWTTADRTRLTKANCGRVTASCSFARSDCSFWTWALWLVEAASNLEIDDAALEGIATCGDGSCWGGEVTDEEASAPCRREKRVMST